MIHLTRISRVPLVLNSDLIEHIEATPDTVVSLTTGQKLLVLETPDEIIDRVVEFRRSISTQPFPAGRAHAAKDGTGRDVVSLSRDRKS